MTDELKHKSIECPFCGKALIVSESQNEVSCKDINCKFNSEKLGSSKQDFAGWKKVKTFNPNE